MTINVTVTKAFPPATAPTPNPPLAKLQPADRTLYAFAEVNKIHLPIFDFNCTRPAYGSVGTFRMETSWEMLNEAKINPYKLGKTTLGQIATDIYMQVNGSEVFHLFGGELDTVVANYDADTVTISGRDWAGILVDKKYLMATNIQPNGVGPVGQQVGLTANLPGSQCPPGATQAYAPTGAKPAAFSPAPISSSGALLTANLQNATPSQFAYSLAQWAQMTPEVYYYPGEPALGVILAKAKVSAGEARTGWSILQFCARMLNWVAYVTPSRKLYFGPPPVNLPTYSFYWNAPDASSLVPDLMTEALEITYNPRRNSNFLVIVVSYDTAGEQITYGSTFFSDGSVPVQQAFPLVQQISQTLYVGSSGATTDVKSLNALFSNLGKPVYVYEFPGLNSADAQRKAFNIALDIAKRELITGFKVNGNPYLEPLTPFTIGGDVQVFSGGNYYVNSLEHSFSMTAGWYTHIHGWTIGPAAGMTPYPLLGGSTGMSAGNVSLMTSVNQS